MSTAISANQLAWGLMAAKGLCHLYFFVGTLLGLNSSVVAQELRWSLPSTGCEHLLSSSERITHLRREILVANKKDQMSGRPFSETSNFIAGRAQEFDSSAIVDSHIVSLGSGPDIYLPLYLFPLAKYYHFVDTLGGWGSGPEDVIEEIESRLHSIAPDVRVERLDALGDWRKIEGVLTEPIVWRVQWRSMATGLQEKTFLLHQLDFNLETSLKRLKEQFSLPSQNSGLGGVVVTGISATLETRRSLLSELHREGSMFTEMLYMDKEGRTSSPDDEAILRDLETDFEITDFGLRDLGFLFSPHQFLIKAKNN